MKLGCRTLPLTLFSLPCTLVSLLLSVSYAAPAPYDFLDNYRDKTQAPVDGPPASYHATRDRYWLPFEICGLVGGYVFTVLIWAVLLLTVGRKMRRKALGQPKTLEVELQNKPMRPTVKTPASPATSWLRKFRKNDSGMGSSPQSPVVQSPSSFDQKVIEADRERAHEEMERLYAAVMDHDRKKNSPNLSVQETQTQTIERRRPSAIIATHHSQDDNSPVSPIRAIYPPNHPNAPQTAPLPRDHLQDQQPPPNPPSILSKRLQNPTTTKTTRFNLKNLRISGSIEKYPGAASDDDARTPLSARFYTQGTPPSPPTQTNSPITPYDPVEELDKVQPLPRPAPQRLPPTIALSNSTSSSPSFAATNSLPLRGYAQPLQSPGIQTTVLDRRVDKLSLTTPKTGVPYTPYSPYMPFTPITPVTPHLVTKKERKVREKGEKSKRIGQKEQVKSSGEIFGDAY